MIDWLARDPRDVPHVDLGTERLPIVVRRHARARRMILRLGPDGTAVRVTLPQWGRTADAIAFAQSRADWIAQQRARMPAAEPVVPGGTLSWRGHALRIEHDAALPRKPVATQTTLALGGPRASVPSRIRRWLEEDALSRCTADLDFYCARIGEEPPPLRLSNAQRRWGSCATSGAIRINWRLIMAPDAIRRSVVAHEAAHLRHFDHSPAFHVLLARIYEDDIAQADRWLKAHGRGLYRSFG